MSGSFARVSVCLISNVDKLSEAVPGVAKT
jgi:hypothetical protein